MDNEVPQSAISASLTSVEANVVIAGVEAVTGIWLVYRLHFGQLLLPQLAETWHWSFAFYAVLGFFAIVISGFTLEAIAGLLERAIVRPLWGSKREVLRQWYCNYTKQPEVKNMAKAQKWIWKSAQANQEFSRRRLRILCARNTATFLLLLTLACLIFVKCGPCWIPLAGLMGTLVFGWLWLDAQKGWNMAVSVAEELGEP